MRVYELAREVKKTNQEVLNAIQAVAPGTRLGVANAVPERIQIAVRAHFTKAAVPNDPVEKYKTEVQKVIDRITNEYGTDWCDSGQRDVKDMLRDVGLNLVPVWDEGVVRVDFFIRGLPSTEFMDGGYREFKEYLQAKIWQAVLNQEMEWEGRKFKVNSLDVSDIESN